MRPIPLDGALYSLVMSYSGSRRPRGHSRANAPRAALTPRDRETCPGNSTWVVDLRQIPYACHALPTAAATSVRSLALYKARCSSVPYLAGLSLASHRHSTYIPDIPVESPTGPEEFLKAFLESATSRVMSDRQALAGAPVVCSLGCGGKVCVVRVKPLDAKHRLIYRPLIGH